MNMIKNYQKGSANGNLYAILIVLIILGLFFYYIMYKS